MPRDLQHNKIAVARYGSYVTYATWREAMDGIEHWWRTSPQRRGRPMPRFQVAKMPSAMGELVPGACRLALPWMVWRVQ